MFSSPTHANPISAAAADKSKESGASAPPAGIPAFLWDIRFLDAFPKTMDDFRVKTLSGAVVSIISLLLMVVLLFSEASYHMSTETVDHLYVNTTRSSTLKVSLDISFHEIPCKMLSLDVVDDAGASQVGTYHQLFKHRLSPTGEQEGEPELHAPGDTLTSEETMEQLIKEHEERTGVKVSIDKPLGDNDCGNCYGAGEKGGCCNSCQEVKDAYERSGWRFKAQGISQCQRESFLEHMHDQFAEDGGCQLYGQMILNKASGHFHIAPHKDLHKGSMQAGLFSLMDLISFTFDQFNITHTVNTLSFGNTYPGIESPLDGQKRTVEDTHGMYQYYVKIVPTRYQALGQSEIESNQYSVTEHLRHLSPGSGRGLPGVYFYYEISPISALVTEKRRGALFPFLTSCCAILGGVFTVMGLVDVVLGGVIAWFQKTLL